MEQEKLIAKFREIQETQKIEYSKAFRHFRSARAYYLPLQDGVASEINFFDYTIVMYNETEKPDREPDFTSGSGSRYWYFKDGIIRGSDHWGNGVANCDWALKLKTGKTLYGNTAFDVTCIKEPKYGFAKWSDFVLKSRLLEINGKEVVTTFNNSIGRDQVKLDGKLYKKVVIETWEEAE